jgi:hypothetical protein
MTIRLISLEAAIAAIQRERLTDNTGQEDDAAYNRALDHAIDALKALSDAWPQSARQADNDGLPFVPFHPKPKSEPPK